TGTAYIDAVSFEITGDALPSTSEPAHPLSGRGLVNLTAYARLYGYIRFFHPSDEGYRADWDAIAIEGVRAVESAANPAELARKLEDHSRPYAAAVRVFPATAPPPALDMGSGAKMIWWQHTGFGSGTLKSVYHSDRRITPAENGKLPSPFL